MSEYSSIAKALINMWNSSFSKTIIHRNDAKSVKLNFVKTFNSLKTVSRNSNKKLKISAYKKPTSNIIIKSKDGCKIVASIWLNSTMSNKWIIGVHGFNSNRFDVLYLTWHYRQLGYNIITFDFRNHGDSDYDKVTWGFKEKWDLMALVNWLSANYNVSEIGIVGTSMGAFTAQYMILSEQAFIQKNKISWMVSDSAYMSAENLIRRIVSDNTLKLFETYAKTVLEDIFLIYKNEFDVDLTELNFIKLIQADQKYVPTLYIHNRFDRVTNFLDSFRMWDIKNNIEKTNCNELIIYNKGYNHTKSIIKFTNDYINRTLDFVKKHQKEQ